MDPLRAVADIIVGLHRTKTLSSWFRLAFSMVFSYIVAFSSGMGWALLAHNEFPLAVGKGLLSAVGAVCLLFYISPLTRNMMISLPKNVNIADSEFQTFEKTK